MRRRLPLATIVPAVIGVIAVGVAIGVIIDNRHTLHDAIHRLGWAPLLESLAFGIGGVYTLVFLWRAVLAGLGEPTRLRPASRVFFISQLGKYLPGSVWPVVSQMEFGRRQGIARRTMLAANVITIALSLAVALVVAAVLLPLSTPSALHRYWWTFLLLPPLLAALHPRAIPALIDALFRLIRREPMRQRLTSRSVAVAVLWSLLSWLLLGLHLFVLIRALGAHGAQSFAAAAGGAAFAVAVGIAFIPAPAGAGVRDAVLVLTLTPSIGSTAALAAALVSRVLLVAVDLILAAVAAALPSGLPEKGVPVRD